MVGSKPLHNFNLPPGLTWGRQKFLRCMNVDQVHTLPAVDNEESLDSSDHNNHRSEVHEFHKIPGERSTNTSPTTPPPLEEDDPKKKVTRPRRNLEKKEDRPKFSITLSRKEIEEDFIVMTGKKPPRKRNKLPKSVQMKLNAVFPGSQLSEVHPDRYKVDESVFRYRRIR